MSAAEEVRNFINQLDAIFESDELADDLIDEESMYEELVDEDCDTVDLESSEDMAPKTTEGGVQDYANPSGQSFAEKNGFVG